MNDLHRQGIFQQRHAKRISGEDLEVLGKQASACWYEKRSSRCGPTTLGESVVEVVKEAGLSPEQVRRVVEFANTDAFLREFHKLSSGHKYVDFGQGVLANVSDVLRDLNDGGGGTVFDAGTGDYDMPPDEKRGQASEEHFMQLFGSGEQEHLPYEEPLRPFWDARDKLAGMHAHISSELSGMELVYEDLSRQLEYLTKQASLEGQSLGQVVQAWSSVTDNPVFIKVAFQKITPGLLRDEVFPSYDAVGASLEKVGSARLANPQHPLVETFHDYCGALVKMAELRYQQEGLGIKLAQVDGLLKESMDPQKAVSAGTKLRQFFGEAAKHTDTAAQGAKGFVNEVTGKPILGSLASGAVKAAPLVAGAGAVKVLADEAGTSAPVQAAIPYLPGSRQYSSRVQQRMHMNNPQVRAAMAAQGGY